jgi:tRNA (guanine37-N1)-methyltransferase
MNSSSKIFSIDSNPKASILCLINAKLNRVQDRVFPFCGDAKYIAGNILSGLSHRVLMPLPEKAKYFVDSAITCLGDNRGYVHYFTHVRASNKRDALNKGKLDSVTAFKRYNHIISTTRVVREVGPRLYQIVSDVLVANR